MKMKLENILLEIELNPALYLGQISITRLSAFLDGYILGTGCASFLFEFQAWVSERYKIKSSHKWNEIILFFEQDERSAFSRFYDLLREFECEQSKAETRGASS